MKDPQILFKGGLVDTTKEFYQDYSRLKEQCVILENTNQSLCLGFGTSFHHIGEEIKNEVIQLVNNPEYNLIGEILAMLGTYLKGFHSNDNEIEQNIHFYIAKLLAKQVEFSLDNQLAIAIGNCLLCREYKFQLLHLLEKSR